MESMLALFAYLALDSIYTIKTMQAIMLSSSVINADRYLMLYQLHLKHRDLRSFEIRIRIGGSDSIRFDSDGPIREFSNRPCLPIARSSQTTQTINGA